MYTRYALYIHHIYTIYTPLNTSKHHIYTLYTQLHDRGVFLQHPILMLKEAEMRGRSFGYKYNVGAEEVDAAGGDAGGKKREEERDMHTTVCVVCGVGCVRCAVY